MPYFSIATRSGPIPKAKPEYSVESKPAISKTLGCTMPAPSISIQPDCLQTLQPAPLQDRKSTRLNSSHVSISYAVFCLKKKKNLDWLIAHGDMTIFMKS